MFSSLAHRTAQKADALHEEKYYFSSWIVSTSSRPVFLLAAVEEAIKTAFQALFCFFYLAINIVSWFDHKGLLFQEASNLTSNTSALLINLTGAFISPYAAHKCQETNVFSKIYSVFCSIFPNEYNYTITFQFLGIKWLSLDIGREFKESLS